MKKIIFAFFASTLASSLCFADGGSVSSSSNSSAASVQVPGGATAAVPAKLENITGEIDSVLVGWGKKTQMTVRDGVGSQSVFLIASDAIIIGKDGSKTTVTWIQGNKAFIEYVTAPNGASRTAKSIKLLSDV